MTVATTAPALTREIAEVRRRRIVVGVGCSSAAEADEIAGLVAQCLAGRQAHALAAPAARAALPQTREAAQRLGLALVAVETGAIEAVQARCLTPPGRAGLSVAEGAALAVAGPEAALLGPRAATRRVTCALAS